MKRSDQKKEKDQNRKDAAHKIGNIGPFIP
jgi:hypothetical protein